MNSSTDSAMPVFESLLKICLPSEESPNRRASLFSRRSSNSSDSTKSSILVSLNESFDNFITTVRQLPTTIETKFEEFVQTVTEIPSQLEESFDNLVNSFNEYGT